MAPQFLIPSFCRSKNTNIVEPASTIYPRKNACDPEYTVPEAKLRGAIHIPKSYTYGKKLAVILCPGTATPAGISYRFNLYRLLAASDFADPLFLNVPGTTVGDIQVTAEYYAYAIHYISSTCRAQSNAKVALIAQSQGCVNAQWALKYWPSTRELVSNFIAISAAFAGTDYWSDYHHIVWPIICPALAQQRSASRFIATLREGGGASALVPTTSIYTADDKLVIPQTGEWASARLDDLHDVGATNVEIQEHWHQNGEARQKVISHVAVIYHAFTWLMIVDALTHRDAGSVKRVDLASVQKRQQHAPGVNALDIALTRIGDLISIVYILKCLPKRSREPPIKAYATAEMKTG